MEEDIQKIAVNLLEGVKARTLTLGIDVSFTENAVKEISIVGFDSVYGARPLKRAITSKIEDLISEEILKGNIKSGDKVICDAENNTFKIIKQ